jgi:lysyl-tRNA synthetase class 2
MTQNVTVGSAGPAAPAGAVPVAGWPAESAGRLEKVEAIRALGLDPYPRRFERTHTLGEIVAAFGSKAVEELDQLGAMVRVAGRVLTKRGHGKASFATVSDGDTRLQVYIRQDDVGQDAYRLFDLIDLGDFVGVAGSVMRTRKGELSVQAKKLVLLSKALLPPPEKWHGLSDVEMRYRRRYLDLMANPEVRRVFVTRSLVTGEIRRFLDSRGYIEVETPMMQVIAGGAAARPFVTHHNALGIDLYLRIAPELYLKRLVVGGFERVYEINRNFRNEGVSSQHNPEFTMLEFYTAYFDCDDVMRVTEQLVASAAAQAHPDRRLSYRDRPLSLEPPYPRMRMVDAVAQAATRLGFELDAATVTDGPALDAWLTKALAGGMVDADGASVTPTELEGLSHGKRIALLFERLAERSFWDPTFITDFPVEISPLAKARPDDPKFTERFELYVAGMEVANGFSELNDPIEQRARFLDQAKERERGDEEAHQMDEDFIRALGHGLPPTGGCGVGIDRLVMVLTDSPSIRDVILFPHMRPEDGPGSVAQDK